MEKKAYHLIICLILSIMVVAPAAAQGFVQILDVNSNTTLDNGNGSELKNPHAVVDTFRLLNPDAKDVGTFNEFKGIRSGDKIDYIFTTPDVKVLEAAILYDNVGGHFPSDHFPVAATVGLLVNSND